MCASKKATSSPAPMTTSVEAETSWLPTCWGRGDWAAIVALCVITFFAWCTSHGMWTSAAWQLPTAYPSIDRDPEKGDVVSVFAYMKAAGEGHARLLGWKTIPELGAPYGANWNDFPTFDEVPFAMHALLCKAFGLFAGFNLGLLLNHLAAAVAFYVVARSLGCSIPAGFVAALAFGLAPYVFAHEPHHIQIANVWPIPLFLPVWRWISSGSGIARRSPRFWCGVAVGVVAGLHNIYYANILCQLTLLGALVTSIRTRSREPWFAAAAIVAATLATLALNNVDTWTYKAVHGPNQGAFVREYKWLEIYGLKIKDLFIPPVTHRSEMLAAFSKAHRQTAPLLDEDGAAYQGIIGIACLIWLAFTAVKHVVAGREKDVPMEAWQVLWIVVMFTTGGLNALFGATTGFTMFRSGCRYSIAILAITLLWAARRLSLPQSDADRPRPTGMADVRWLAAATCACLVILWDQVPRAPTAEQAAAIARQVAADRDFTAKMEASLPDGAMVFQMPVMEFPESPVPGMPSYDHFRPYLYSRHLRYSFGSMKGREREKWQPAVQAKFFEGASLDQQVGRIRVNEANARAAVNELKRLGFSAIYINRNGFPDRGRGIESTLLDLGYTKPVIRNATGELACIVLETDGTNDRPPKP